LVSGTSFPSFKKLGNEVPDTNYAALV